jgi:segregation and condensation protein A
MSDFVVETDEFSGPVAKLLEMIRSRKLYINDISLAKVTDAYLEHIAEHEESLDSMAEFVRIAATLVLAKSKALLPEQTTEDQKEEINQLEERLRAYRMTKKRADTLQEMFGQSPLFASHKNPHEVEQPVFAPGNTLTVEKIAQTVAGCLIDLPDSGLKEDHIEETIALKDELNRLQDRCREIDKTTFAHISRSDNKHHQVVTFVAILELVKTNKLKVQQENNFSTITIKHDE